MNRHVDKQNINLFKSRLFEFLGHEPTACQQEAVNLLADFLFLSEDDTLFLLNGYAGTGKTTLISSFVKTLDLWRIRNYLLAPTGRAAKVLGSYAGKTAHTIHRFIYLLYTAPDGSQVIVPRKNQVSRAIFIVDEVSMIQGFDIPDDESQAFSGRNILDDLMQFVYENPGCKMIFVGDKAQLPPVGSELSPALDNRLLAKKYTLNIIQHTLNSVVRQAAGSGILDNATNLREKINSNDIGLPLLYAGTQDVKRISGFDLMDELAGAFSRHDQAGSVIITRSNKRANLYNREIRNRILFREHEIEGGDLMMVVKNNYFWLPENSPAGFIANGDMLEIIRIRNIEEHLGFRFADAIVRFADYTGETDFEVKLLLSAIYSESASLSAPDQQALFHRVREDIALTYEGGVKGVVSKHPYYNALQVKFAYALTCHKTQGGQWERVFVDQGWLPEDRIDKEYLRWLYTAVARATEMLSLVGFNDKYIGNYDYKI